MFEHSITGRQDGPGVAAVPEARVAVDCVTL